MFKPSKNPLARRTTCPSFSRRELGELGEQYAAKYLRKKGLRLLHKNWRCRAGEIDLIMADNQTLVFVEVKTRLFQPQTRGYLLDNITVKKKRKLRFLTEIFLAKNYGKGRTPGVRIDAVGVLINEGDLSLREVIHIVAAV